MLQNPGGDDCILGGASQCIGLNSCFNIAKYPKVVRSPTNLTSLLISGYFRINEMIGFPW